MKISKLVGLVCGVAFLLGQRAALADVSIGDSGATVDFTGFTGAGFAATPTAGQLSSNDWAITGFSDGDLNFGGNNTSADYTRGASAVGVTTGGIYAFSSAGNVFLGVKPSDVDFTPGTFTLRFKSSVAHPIVKLGVSYRIVSMNDQPRGNSLKFSWSLDNVTYTAITALDFATANAADTAPAWTAVTKTTTLTTTIATNGNLYFRWTSDIAGGTGNSDELGIDDIVVTPQNACGDGVAQGSEECDDGNQSNTDNCLNTCVQATCGDGFVRTGEQCDPGTTNSVCCSTACTKQTGNTCPGGTCNNGVCVHTGAGGAGGEAGETGTAGETSTAGGGAGGESAGGAAGESTVPPVGGMSAGGMSAGGMSAGGMSAGGTTAGGTAGGEAAGMSGRATTAGTSSGGAGAGGKAGSSGSSSTGVAGKAGKGGSGSTPTPPAPAKDDGGCGCSVPRSSNHGALALVMTGALVAFMRRRRR